MNRLVPDASSLRKAFLWPGASPLASASDREGPFPETYAGDKRTKPATSESSSLTTVSNTAKILVLAKEPESPFSGTARLVLDLGTGVCGGCGPAISGDGSRGWGARAAGGCYSCLTHSPNHWYGGIDLERLPAPESLVKSKG